MPCGSPVFSVIDQPGEYTFHLGSTHQSQLTINGEVIAGLRSRDDIRWTAEKVSLATGRHDIDIGFVGRPREEEDEFAENRPPQITPVLHLEYEGLGIDRQSIEPALLAATPPRSSEPVKFTPQPKLIKAGRNLFRTKGCASCHELIESGTKVSSEITATPLTDLPLGKNLAHVSRNTPNFALSEKQQQLLNAYLTAAKNSPEAATPRTDADVILHDMLSLNCFRMPHTKRPRWRRSRPIRPFPNR